MKNVAAYVLFFAMAACQAQEKSNVLSPADFENAIRQSNIQLLDVRTAGEYQGGHIAHALQANWTNPDEFKERVQALDKNKPLYVYCASGVRSAAAAEWLREAGFKDVYNLDGGMMAWRGAHMPVEGMPQEKLISPETYQQQVATGTVLVDFGAEWCPPCRKMAPVLEQLKKDLAGKFTLLPVDAGSQSDLVSYARVDKLPTFILYRDGKEVWRYTGLISKEELRKQIVP